MNKTIAFLSIAIIAIVSLSSLNLANTTVISSSEDAFEIPENIDAIFNESCYGCHNSESNNMKAKMKLKLDDLTTMKKSKMISKLSKIAKEVEKGDMPSKKFLAKYPDKALSDEDKKALIEWAKSSAAELAGE